MTAALDIVKGRSLVLTVTNKSGGSVAKGDVVVVDTANDAAFTTTTTGRAEVTVGVVIEENGIANNASGRVLLAGFAPLVNVPASVTRGHYVETHTVAKQATGSSTRRSGSFGQFLTGGTTPTAWLWGQTDQTATGGGGGITHAYLGYNTIGGSTEAFTADRVYAKKITAASAGWLGSLGIYMTSVSQVSSMPAAAVWTDNTGDVGNLIFQSGPTGGTNSFFVGSARWMTIPLGLWVTAADYWIGMHVGPDVAGTPPNLYYDGSGSDRRKDPGGEWIEDGGYTDTTRKYSIRASLLT